MNIDNSRKTNVYYPRPVTKENEKVNYALIVNHVAQYLWDSSYTEMLTKAKSGDALNTYDFSVKSKIKFDYKKNNMPFYSSNVIGVIEGTDKKDEYVFLTGHYDHLGKRGDDIYYGADDDGSGTVWCY